MTISKRDFATQRPENGSLLPWHPLPARSPHPTRAHLLGDNQPPTADLDGEPPQRRLDLQRAQPRLRPARASFPDAQCRFPRAKSTLTVRGARHARRARQDLRLPLPVARSKSHTHSTLVHCLGRTAGTRAQNACGRSTDFHRGIRRSSPSTAPERPSSSCSTEATTPANGSCATVRSSSPARVHPSGASPGTDCSTPPPTRRSSKASEPMRPRLSHARPLVGLTRNGRTRHSVCARSC